MNRELIDFEERNDLVEILSDTFGGSGQSSMAGSNASISSVTPSKIMEMSFIGDERSEGRVGI